MRPELLTPEELDEEVLCAALGLVGESVTYEAIGRWAPLERAIAYDWAMREHLSASDNPTRRRPRPAGLLGEKP